MLTYYLVNAFTGAPDDHRFYGNPALVVYHDLSQNEAQPILSSMAKRLKYPILVSLTPGDQVRFFETSGFEINMCGHGSLAALAVARALGRVGPLLLCTNPSFQSVNQETTISLTGGERGERVALTFPMSKELQPASDWQTLASLLHLDGELFSCWETGVRDLVVLLESARTLHQMTPDFGRLGEYLTASRRRLVLSVAPALEPEFDWEIRAMGPHWGLDDDLACGSANASVYPTLLHEGMVTSHKVYRNLFRYTDTAGGLWGGCQWVLFESGQIRIEGYTDQVVAVDDPIPFDLNQFLASRRKKDPSCVPLQP